MGKLKAALYKDLLLFFRGTGLAVVILPLALLLALRAGLGDLSVQAYVQPFPIAVRDKDNTLMSRSLISQIAQIQLFSRVDRLEEGTSDQEALEAGAAAVVTVPKDFFYDLYKMEDCPVDVTLNGEMKLESSLFQSIFCSVMDIIAADQAAGRGMYRFCYGELTPQLERELFAEASAQLLQDALGRQLVFDTQETQSDTAGALERRLLACILSLLSLFFSLSAVKTLPEELELGVLPRWRAAGGRLLPFFLSKLLSALASVVPTLILVLLVLPVGHFPAMAFTALLLFLSAFGMTLFLAAWSRGPAAAQRWGNLYLLLSLVLGGALWPRRLLPQPLPLLGGLTLPYYAVLGLEAASRGAGPLALLSLLWPALLMGAVGGALAVPGLRRRRADGARLSDAPISTSPVPPPEGPLTGLGRRLSGLTALKLRAMAGGWRGLAALLCTCLLCGLAAWSVQYAGVSALSLSVCDLDNTPLSQQLVERLSRQEGLDLTLCSRAEGERALLLGETEGLLVIGSGYAGALASGEQTPLHYSGTSAAVSAQGAREIVAGQVAAQRSRLRAADDAARRLGRDTLSPEEEAGLMALIDQEEESQSPLYHISTAEGRPAPDPFVPDPFRFSALAVLLTLFTFAAWGSGPDGRQAERRMSSLPRGRLLSWGSSCLALTGLGLLSALAILSFSGFPGGWTLCSAAVYSFCAAALALTLARLSRQEGRVDGLAPFLALILCLLGGCFLDLSQLSPGLALLSLCTPPGLALRASEGSWQAAAVLLAAGGLLSAAGLYSFRDSARPRPRDHK